MPTAVPSTMPLHFSSDSEPTNTKDIMTESGYASATSSDDELPEVVFSKPHLQFLNRQLQFLEPQGWLSLHLVVRIDC